MRITVTVNLFKKHLHFKYKLNFVDVAVRIKDERSSSHGSWQSTGDDKRRNVTIIYTRSSYCKTDFGGENDLHPQVG